MKTKKLQIMGTLLGMSMTLACFNSAYANNQQYLDSDPININGYVQPEVEATDQELETIRGDIKQAQQMNNINKKKTKNYKKLVDETEKLSETSEEMIKERQAAQKEIKQYKKKVDCMMGRASGPECDQYVDRKRDEVRVMQAAPAPAPAPVVAAPAPAPQKDINQFGGQIKVLPYTGITNFFSETEELEANISAGIKVESNVNERFSVGMGFHYTSMATTDFANTLGGFDYYDVYNDIYGSREIDYKNMNFSLYSKFFIIKNNRFRPYIGGGLGYNRTSMAYTDNRQFNPTDYGYGYNSQFGKEEVTTSSINAELMVGSEVIFTETFGMVLEFNYMRGLGGNLSTDKGLDEFSAPDQQRLEDLSNELSEANILSLYAGMMVAF